MSKWVRTIKDNSIISITKQISLFNKYLKVTLDISNYAIKIYYNDIENITHVLNFHKVNGKTNN